MDSKVDEVLRRAIAAGASDVHLKVGSPPITRVGGELRRMDDMPSLTPADTQSFADDLLTPGATADFKENGNADFAYGKNDLGRFRVTAFRQRGSVSLVLRRVLAGSKTFMELGLPKTLEKVAAKSSGLILVTGPSGSGKSTTMAAFVDWINTNRSAAILTIEDPIEVLHPDKRSAVVQREVGVDTRDIADAVRGAMRHDVDVIMISELNNQSHAEAAINAAETGHLVISSMRTSDPAETISRLVSFFPEGQKDVVRTQLANQVQAIVSQVLVESSNSQKILACEVMTSNERAHEWILSPGDSSFLVEVIKDSGFHGMQTFDQSLLKHVVERTVDISAALPHARNSHEMRAKAMAAGIAV